MITLPNAGGTCDASQFAAGKPVTGYGYGALGSTLVFVGISIRNDGPDCELQLPQLVGVASEAAPVIVMPTQIPRKPSLVDIHAGQTVSIVLGDSWWTGMTDEAGASMMPTPRCDGKVRDINRVVYPFASGTIDIGLDISWREVCTAPPSVTVTVEDTGFQPYPTPPPVATATCTASQVRLTPGHTGAAAGTAYMRVFVELDQGPECSLPQGPQIALVSDDGTVLVNGTDADPRPLVISGITGYEIGWNVGCDASSPPRALSARIWFSAAVYVDMPIGDFGPSCVDGSTGSLFMRADEP